MTNIFLQNSNHLPQKEIIIVIIIYRTFTLLEVMVFILTYFRLLQDLFSPTILLYHKKWKGNFVVLFEIEVALIIRDVNSSSSIIHNILTHLSSVKQLCYIHINRMAYDIISKYCLLCIHFYNMLYSCIHIYLCVFKNITIHSNY